MVACGGSGAVVVGFVKKIIEGYYKSTAGEMDDDKDDKRGRDGCRG